jgi:hypothetical protein
VTFATGVDYFLVSACFPVGPELTPKSPVVSKVSLWGEDPDRQTMMAQICRLAESR